MRMSRLRRPPRRDQFNAETRPRAGPKAEGVGGRKRRSTLTVRGSPRTAVDLPRQPYNYMPLCAAAAVLNSTFVVEPPNSMEVTRSVLPSMEDSTAVRVNF